MKLILNILFFAILLTATALAQINDSRQRNFFGMDSTLYRYLQKCEAVKRSEVVLKMSDTLFKMAKDKKSNKMMCVAMCTKLNYFVYMRNMDSVQAYAKKIKKFAKKINMPEYFYYAWTKIAYLKYMQLQLFSALSEAKKIQNYAMKDGNIPGMLDAMNLIGGAYVRLLMPEEALKVFLEICEIAEKNQLKEFNLYTYYLQPAKSYAELRQFDKALAYLKKSEQLVQRDVQLTQVYNAYANTYLKMKKYDKAKEYIDKSLALNMEGKGSPNTYNMVKARLFDYALATNNKKILKESFIDNKENFIIITTRKKALFYKRLNNYQVSNAYYKLAITKEEKTARQNNGALVMDIAGSMDVERLKFSNNQLEIDIHKRNMQILMIILISVGVILIVVLKQLLKIRKINKSVLATKNELVQTNSSLEETKKELLIRRDKLVNAKNELANNNRALLSAKNDIILTLEKAQNANRLKEVFINNLSHEIRTPMNAIVGYSQLLVEVFGSDTRMQSFTVPIVKGVNNLLKMITDIIDLSLMDSENYVSKKNKYNLRKIIEKCISATKNRFADEVKVTFTNLIGDYYIENDRYATENIIINTLLNAAKFTNRGLVNVFCSNKAIENKITIEIMDTGIGIPKQYTKKIFERYYKIDTFSQGLGVGLELSKCFAKILGAEYFLDENYTNGAKFVLNLKVEEG